MQAVDLRNIRRNIYFGKAVVSFLSKIILKKLNQESKSIFQETEEKTKKYAEIEADKEFLIFKQFLCSLSYSMFQPLKMQAVVLRNIRKNIFIGKAVVFFLSNIVLKKLNQESKSIFRQLEVKTKR